MLYFPTQHDISTFTSSSAGNEIGTPLLGFGHQKQHRGMITSQKGLTSLYQLRCIQKSPHEYARKRQFIRTTSLKSLKRLQAPTTTSDLYLGRLLSSATIFFPPFCNRCSSNSFFLTQGGKESVDIAAEHKPQQAGRRAGRQDAKKVIQN